MLSSFLFLGSAGKCCCTSGAAAGAGLTGAGAAGTAAVRAGSAETVPAMICCAGGSGTAESCSDGKTAARATSGMAWAVPPSLLSSSTAPASLLLLSTSLLACSGSASNCTPLSAAKAHSMFRSNAGLRAKPKLKKAFAVLHACSLLSSCKLQYKLQLLPLMCQMGSSPSSYGKAAEV